MGDLLLTYHLDGGNELVTINNDEQMEHNFLNGQICV